MPRPSKRLNTAAIVAALNTTRGKVYLAAKALGCHRDTIYERAKKSQAIQDAINQPRGEMVDTAELSLERAIQAGEAWAVCFTLKTQGKDRGYIERQEISGPDGGPITTEIREIVVRTREEAAAVLSRLSGPAAVPGRD